MALLQRAYLNDFDGMPGMRDAWHEFVSLTAFRGVNGQSISPAVRASATTILTLRKDKPASSLRQFQQLCRARGKKNKEWSPPLA